LHWLQTLMDINREDGADELLSKLKYAKSLGYKIIYTAHNISSHDSKFLERELRFRREISAYFNHVIVHGEIAKQRIIDEIGVDEKIIHVMPHGTYQGYYPNDVTRESARIKFNIAQDKFVFQFFGNIKGYKGVDALIDAYKKIRSKRNDIILLIAGRVLDNEIKSKLIAYSNTDASILLNLEFVADEDVQYYYNAADLVILPYNRILTSGAALLSIAFERPLIAPRSGLLPELIENGKQGYLFDDYGDMLALMERSVEQHRQNPTAWGSKFDFSDLNTRLCWSSLTAPPSFSNIF
jgi:glycosyltransferase involved in cell wall biosynthesis